MRKQFRIFYAESIFFVLVNQQKNTSIFKYEKLNCWSTNYENRIGKGISTEKFTYCVLGESWVVKKKNQKCFQTLNVEANKYVEIMVEAFQNETEGLVHLRKFLPKVYLLLKKSGKMVETQT